MRNFSKSCSTSRRISTATGMEKLLLARYREVDWPQFNQRLNALARACEECDETAVRSLLDELVPEFESERRIRMSSNVNLPRRRHTLTITGWIIRRD